MSYTISLTKNKESHDSSIMGKVKDFSFEMKSHEEESLKIYKKNPHVSACDRVTSVYNRHDKKTHEYILFGSNGYLGASILETAKKKAIEAIETFGIGTGSVPLLTGTTIYQEILEKTISNLVGFDDAILFSSGYTANIGAIAGLLRKNNIVIHDKLNHASLLDATILSGCKMARFKHGDMHSLEMQLKKYHKEFPGGIMIATDGVFSMDGDIAKIPQILELAKKYEAIVLIDEAHATGVIGEFGAGTLSHYNITGRNNIIITGPLSKAIGTVGGYVTASQNIIDYLRIYARSNMFSTSLPPSVCASAIEVFKALQETDIVERLRMNTNYFIKKMNDSGFNILKTETPIIPLIIGNAEKLTEMSADALREGYIINPIYPPAVPANLTRFRISIMACHRQEDMDGLVDLLISLFEKYSLPHYVS